MESNLVYPNIMKPGELTRLNEYIISRLGTPLFFAVSDLVRPNGQDSIGVLYEVITGLYIIYKDFGIKILENYLEFCRDNSEKKKGYRMLSHYDSIKDFRSGLCHGNLFKGGYNEDFNKILKKYFSKNYTEDCFVTTCFNSDKRVEYCEAIVKKMVEHSNQLVEFVKECADNISKNEALLNSWRQKLVQDVFNNEKKQYNNNFFDERIVWELERKIIRGNKREPHQETIKKWLGELKPKIINGEIHNSDELLKSLKIALDNLYNPATFRSGKSSSGIFLKGFDLSSLIGSKK